MLGHSFFHDLFRSYVVLFGNLFDSIKVHRYDNNRNRIQTLSVPIEYGPRQKTLTRITQNPDFDQPTSIIVPRISYQITNLRRNNNLQLFKLDRWVKQTGDDKDKFFSQFQCIPYQIDFELTVYVKNSYDGFQIVEQIIPFFSPEFSITANPLRIFDYDLDYKEDIKIILNSVQENDDVMMTSFPEKRVILWTLNFTMNAPFYGPVNKIGIIKKSIANIFMPPGNGEVSNNDIINTPAALTYTVQPGLTIDGQPTTNVANSIHYSLIDSDDNWAYAETWTDNVVGKTSYAGEYRAAQDAARIIATQMATTNLLANGVAAQVKVQNIKTNSNSLEIDLRDGEYIILTLEHTLNNLQIINWPMGYLTKVTIEVRNTGAFFITSWSSAIWDGGVEPMISLGFGKKDIFMFHSGDGGQTIYGSVIGQDFS